METSIAIGIASGIVAIICFYSSNKLKERDEEIKNLKATISFLENKNKEHETI